MQIKKIYSIGLCVCLSLIMACILYGTRLLPTLYLDGWMHLFFYGIAFLGILWLLKLKSSDLVAFIQRNKNRLRSSFLLPAALAFLLGSWGIFTESGRKTFPGLDQITPFLAIILSGFFLFCWGIVEGILYFKRNSAQH